ncbi:hypothetical protein QEF67_004709 [Klebsiella aerogenes]|uniref:hypothetical protein n=2 Tax=Enterobacterales TaxID=91347 RepID=UPI002A2ADE35|nr:hypothetical protein [Klebsiella aerogenes]
MTIKLTKLKVKDLIDTLNALICAEDVLSQEQRENMVLCVATLGALGERYSFSEANTSQKETQNSTKKEKKPREPDPVFPRNGKPWTNEDLSLIHSIIDDIPDEDIEFHIVWLANKQGRTPYAIALKVVSEGRCNEEWTKQFKPMAKEIREEYALKNSTI